MRAWCLAVLPVLLPIAAPSAQAQSNVEARVGRLESEMRAVQRKVFPQGAGAYLEPQITAADRAEPPQGAPASSAIDDLTQRVVSLEAQMATLTGQIEQNQYRLRQLEEQFTAYRQTTNARLAAGAPVAAVGGAADAPLAPRPAARPPAGASAPAPAPADAARDPARAQQIAALQRPATGDAGEDAYLYGYRLWDARLYPEAIAQLKKVVADHPHHRRASYAQNLIGRSYLDDNKPSLASIAFYENYKKMPDGERAPDSLFYLAQALIKLNKRAEACKVYDELTDVYGAKLTAQRRSEVATGRTAARCG